MSDQAVDERPRGNLEIAPVRFREAARGTWRCLLPETRRRLILSGVLGLGLAIVDGAAVSLLPTLVDRVGGRADGWSREISVPVLSAIIGGLLLFKSCAGAALVWWQSHFLARDEGEHTIDLFSHLVTKPYGELAQINSNEVVRDLHVSMPMLYRGGATGLGLGMVDGLSLLLLVAVVLLQSPATGIVLAVLAAGSGIAYSSLIRRPVAALGGRILSQTEEVLRDMTEGLESIKTVKAFGAEATVIDRFTSSRRRFELPMRDFQAYQQLSRYFLEVALVIVLGASIGVVYVVEGSDGVFATVGLLSGVAARAMPAMARLLNSITNVRVVGPVVDSLQEDLAAIETSAAAAVETGHQPDPVTAERPVPSIVLDEVSFRYPSAGADTLAGVSMEVRTGEIVAVVGESGSGKTSVVDVMVGLRRPASGAVRIPPGATVGYVAQETFVWDEGIGFNVSLGRPAEDPVGEVWSVLARAQLETWVRTLPDPLETPLGERGNRMSGGQRQRLGIARALYGGPSFLVLDEPTSSLDTATSRSIMETLSELKGRIGVVVVTHDPLVLEYADRSLHLAELQRP